MEIILLLAALITAYSAGIAALFAPCCIGVLLPAYFGSIFRQKRTVVLMTIIFFLGLLTVFLPLGLGMGFLGQLFKEYHDIIYIAAGAFFLILSAVILSGLHVSMPFRTTSQIKVTGTLSVFVLGIFSGVATLCCAPVLAGAIALSVLPGSIFWGGIYSVIYVTGMVSPLFIISYYLDKKNVMEKINLFRKEIKYSLFKREISLNLSDLLSGGIFLIMGALLLYKSTTKQITMSSSGYSLQINILMSKLTTIITQILNNPIGLIILLSFFLILLTLAVKFFVIKYRRYQQ
ncbi:hypothetical protein COV14_04820 [Candidatus Woesearchaeota archaeon CG10_big_fil_rev_8_21_14_0_10_33_12]|nr:MAG: hypothetical protein COV14_04820 [Candidatus Woesearchaeota archaeon CG10_big_fil_rev_8_21_14_0_10_33_12]